MANDSCKHMCGAPSGGALYGLGVIGAAFYYFQHVTTFGGGVMALVHAVFWPAFVLYKVLGMLKM